jgi:hypothetical protein
VLDLPPTTLPAKPVAEIASYGSTSAWVDPRFGVVVRRGGAAQTLKLEPEDLHDLDLGPAADGTPTAVYVRCTPNCKVYASSLKPGAAARETEVRAARGGRWPSLWKGTLAFTRSGWTYTLKLGTPGPAKKLLKASDFTDLELGPREIAFAGEYDSDAGNGITEVDLVPLSRPRGDWYAVDEQVIGEGSAAGFGGLTASADGTFTWARAFRVGCASPKRVARHGSMRHVGGTIARSGAPLAARYADPEIPATPMSEDCDAPE